MRAQGQEGAMVKGHKGESARHKGVSVQEHKGERKQGHKCMKVK